MQKYIQNVIKRKQSALKTSLLCINVKLLQFYKLYCVFCRGKTHKNDIKWKAEAPFCVIFDAQLSLRVSTLVTQTSGSVYWPQVLAINIHDAGACAFPISECLSFPDLSVNTFKVDVFAALLFDLESPGAPHRQGGDGETTRCKPVVDSSFYEHFIFDTVCVASV